MLKLPRHFKLRKLQRGFVRIGLRRGVLGGSFDWRSLFRNGEQGCVFEAQKPSDLYARTNLFLNSEGGRATAASNTNTTDAGASITGFTASIQFPASATLALLYRGGYSPQPGATFTLSAIVQMDDNSVPVSSPNSNLPSADLSLQVNNAPFAADTVTAVPGVAGAYRLSKTFVHDGLTTNIGIVRYATQSGKGFRVTAMQVNKGALQPYQKVTDWTTEYLAAVGHLVTQFTDSAGTTPILNLEDPCGFHVDTRFGGLHGANIFNDASAVLNGESSRVSAGVYRLFSSAGAYSAVDCGGAPGVVGETYEISFNIDSVSTVGGGITIDGFDLTSLAGAVWNTTGPKRVIAKATQAAIGLKRNTVSQIDYQVSGLIFKRLYGNHRSQSSAASRPRLSARYNKCTNRNANPVDLTNVGFINAGNGLATLAVVNDAAAIAAAPDEVKRACTLGNAYKVDNSAGDSNASFVPGGTSGSTNAQQISAYVRGSGAAALRVQGIASAATALTTDYQLRTRSITPAVGTAQLVFEVPAGSVAYIVLNDMREVCDRYLPTPQIVWDSTTGYDDTGFPAYLYYDGVDDFMVTGTVDFTGTDKVTVFAGFTKLSDVQVGVLAELSANTGTNSGAWRILAPGTAGTADLNFGSRGDVGAIVSSAANGYAAASSIVLTGTAAILSDSLALRVNGVQTGASALDQGNGNYGNYPLYFGRRGGTSLPFTGREFIVAIRGAATNDSVIRKAERAVARRMGGVSL